MESVRLAFFVLRSIYEKLYFSGFMAAIGHIYMRNILIWPPRPQSEISHFYRPELPGDFTPTFESTSCYLFLLSLATDPLETCLFGFTYETPCARQCPQTFPAKYTADHHQPTPAYQLSCAFLWCSLDRVGLRTQTTKSLMASVVLLLQ